ncbi:MAG: nucleotidyltransferase family protein [Candidatus Heimdallarchaeota archaeon]
MAEHLRELQEKILPIAKRHGVRKLALFGSSVRGELREDSDIDILVTFEGEKSLLDLISLELELQEALDRSIDVLTYNSIHPLLRDQILNEQVVILS